MVVADVPKAKPLFAGVNQALHAFQNDLVTVGGGVACTEDIHEFVLSGEEVRAVDRKERSILLDDFAARKDKKFLDVTVDTADVVPAALLVGGYGADSADGEEGVTNMDKRLRDSGYLTRDSRMKERKKYGRKGARKSFQFSKR